MVLSEQPCRWLAQVTVMKMCRLGLDPPLVVIGKCVTFSSSVPAPVGVHSVLRTYFVSSFAALAELTIDPTPPMLRMAEDLGNGCGGLFLPSHHSSITS